MSLLAQPLRKAPASAAVDEKAYPSADFDGVKSVVRDDGMGVREARLDIGARQARIVGQDVFHGFACASRLRISSTEILIPRMIGLPPKMAGSEVMCESSSRSFMFPGQWTGAKRIDSIQGMTRRSLPSCQVLIAKFRNYEYGDAPRCVLCVTYI
jgi:hypothetical protein